MKNPSVVIIDYDMGNLGSITNMIKKIGGTSVITQNRKKVAEAKKLILPGDGAFDTGLSNLKRYDLIGILNEKVLKDKTPVLGICIGMQLMSEGSEEGKLSGLSWIKGKTIRFDFSKKSINLRIPHMGWNTIDFRKKSVLFERMPKEPRFYFVHSYHLLCSNKQDILTTTNYGYDFASSIEKENIYTTQFHPEKSHKFGMQLLTNFLNI